MRFWITGVFYQHELYLQITRYEMTQSWCQRDRKSRSHPGMQLAPVRVFSCKHPLTTSALFFKQPGKLIRENKHLNASQLCKCWNISTADLWSDHLILLWDIYQSYLCIQHYKRDMSVNHMRFKTHRIWIFVRAKLWKFLSLIENYKTNRFLKTTL